MMTYRISRNICIQHEEIFDLLVNYSTLHYIKILWIYNIWYMICIGFLLKILLYQRFHTFFGDFTPFFHTFFNFFFHHIIRLLNCYKNIYGLHRFSIENSSILAISHLFRRFHTFFSHLFQNISSLYNPPT